MFVLGGRILAALQVGQMDALLYFFLEFLNFFPDHLQSLLRGVFKLFQAFGVCVLDLFAEPEAFDQVKADDADNEIIQPSSLRGDQKAALWLYAWSLMDPNEQRRAARDYLELVAD